jgi:DNA-binding CsgD family transcriptional regulator
LTELNVDAPRLRRAKTATRDGASVIEAAYDLSGADESWLEGVVRALEPFLGRGLGVFGMFHSLAADGVSLEVHTPVFVNCPEAISDREHGARTPGLSDGVLPLHCGCACKSLSQAVSAASGYSVRPETLGMLSKAGAADLLLARVDGLEPCAISFAAPVPFITRFPPRTASLMARLGRHIAAGYRLRRALAPARSFLFAAATQLGTAHTGFHKQDAERALTLWRTLIDGRYSLIDAIDYQGRRYLLARRNEPGALGAGGLAPEERVVLALFAMGHCGKIVAYELGIAASTVSTRLQRGLHKLGLRSVVELMRVLPARGGVLR